MNCKSRCSRNTSKRNSKNLNEKQSSSLNKISIDNKNNNKLKIIGSGIKRVIKKEIINNVKSELPGKKSCMRNCSSVTSKVKGNKLTNKQLIKKEISKNNSIKKTKSSKSNPIKTIKKMSENKSLKKDVFKNNKLNLKTKKASESQASMCKNKTCKVDINKSVERAKNKNSRCLGIKVCCRSMC